MLRVLLTGMSATGKSTLVAELVARGHRAIDTDYGWTEVLPDGRLRWREDAIEALLDDEQPGLLFVAGCEENQLRFHPRFDLIVLLSVPHDVTLERLRTRTNNPFGKDADELARIIDDVAHVEPLLRRVAHHEVVTTGSPTQVADEVMRLVDESQGLARTDS